MAGLCREREKIQNIYCTCSRSQRVTLTVAVNRLTGLVFLWNNHYSRPHVNEKRIRGTPGLYPVHSLPELRIKLSRSGIKTAHNYSNSFYTNNGTIVVVPFVFIIIINFLTLFFLNWVQNKIWSTFEVYLWLYMWRLRIP